MQQTQRTDSKTACTLVSALFIPIFLLFSLPPPHQPSCTSASLTWMWAPLAGLGASSASGRFHPVIRPCAPHLNVHAHTNTHTHTQRAVQVSTCNLDTSKSSRLPPPPSCLLAQGGVILGPGWDICHWQCLVNEGYLKEGVKKTRPYLLGSVLVACHECVSECKTKTWTSESENVP